MNKYNIKLWVDDIRPAPEGYIWCHSVNEAIKAICKFEDDKDNLLDEWDFPPAEIWNMTIEVIDIDHDAGDYFKDGGDYIEILNWLEEFKIPDTTYLFGLHTRNPVGRMNMKAIIEHNNWRLI